LNNAYGPEKMAVVLPKSNATSNDPLATISEGIIEPSGVFSIQQEFDNTYAITNIDFVRMQTGLRANECTAIEIKLKADADVKAAQTALQAIVGKNAKVQTRYEQNSNLYNTMKTEKWVIYAVLTLILIIAAFNMIGALTMLVLEKKHDIAILQSMGARSGQVKKIFLSEGLLLGGLGTALGVLLALIIGFLQLQFKLLKLSGGSFLIDYFPLKFVAQDFLLVVSFAMAIVLIASWLPAYKASKQNLTLK
jgi:lipoprotein-releasing system permease protein